MAVKDKAGKIAEKSTTIKTTANQVAESITSGKTYISNTNIKDGYGNNVKVPAGFKIANPSDTVSDGIVIEDVNAGNTNTKGSQFVWIPVGNVYIDSCENYVTIWFC